MKVELEQIDNQLREIAGNTPYRLRPHKGAKVSVRETDNRVDIRVNLSKIRGSNQLNDVIQFCATSLGGID